MTLSLTASFSAFGIEEQPALISPQFVGTPGIDDIPFCIDEDVITDAEHTVRLRYLETEDNVAAFSNPDGSATMYYFSNPIKYTDIYGNTVDIDNTVETFGELTDEYKFKTKSAPATTYLPATIGMGEDVKVEHNGFSVQIIPMSDRFAAGTTVASELKTGKDSAVLYSNVFGTGRSLKYTTLYNGVKEDIILNSYVANANSFNFIVKTNGLELAEIDGRYVIRDTLGIPMFELSPIFVYDSAEVPNSTGGTYTIEVIKPNDIYALTLTVDETWLSSATYPVTIDPTCIYDTNSTFEDAFQYPGNTLSTGGSNVLVIGNRNGTINRSFVKFPQLLNHPVYNSLARDDRLVNIDLHFKTYSYGCSSDITLYAYTLSSPWSEYNHPATYPYNDYDGYVATNIFNRETWTTLDIKPILDAWIDPTSDSAISCNYGIILKTTEENASNADKLKYVLFHSAQATNAEDRPYLTMDYSKYSTPNNAVYELRENRFYWLSPFDTTTSTLQLGNSNSICNKDYTSLSQRILFTHTTDGKYLISTEAAPTSYLTLNTSLSDVSTENPTSITNRHLWYIVCDKGDSLYIMSVEDPSVSLSYRLTGTTYSLEIGHDYVSEWFFEKCPTFYGQQMSIIEGYEYWDGSELDKVKFIYSGDYSGKSLLLENSNEDALFAGCTSVAYSMILDNLGVKANVRDFRYDRGNDTSPKWRPVDPFYMALANTGHLLTSVNTVDPRLNKTYSSSNSPVAVQLPYIDENGISHPDTRFSKIIERDTYYDKEKRNATTTDMIYALINELENHPEGIYVFFHRSNDTTHAIVFTKYIGGETLDSTPENDFIVYDPAARSHNNTESGSGVLFSNCKTYKTSGTYMLTFEDMEYFVSIKITD